MHNRLREIEDTIRWVEAKDVFTQTDYRLLHQIEQERRDIREYLNHKKELLRGY